MIKSFIKKLLGNHNDRQIARLEKIVPLINRQEEAYQKLSDEELKKLFAEFRTELSEHPEKIDEKIVKVFAAVKNVCRRLCGKKFLVRDNETKWEIVPYDVQLIGGMVLHEGKIAEMKTGEGKTLVCTLPVVLNALTGKGVHVVTVNDYLAQRDSEWMNPIYDFCGLSVGVVVHGLNTEQRKEAYKSDITYGTNNEFGFDYLRDNMAQNIENIVQRDLHFAIVDEVDSILIDEARTPLIISTQAEESTDKYVQASEVVKNLQEDTDYTIDYKQKSAHLTEDGIKKLEEIMRVQNLFTESGFEEVHHIENALKAKVIMQRDQDYVIRDGQVIIIDEFTGRMMPGRRYSDGLHQALEAKEKVNIQRESKTLATITFQNYFRLYKKLAGMTGTAETEAEEFAKIYQLDTIVIPTNQTVQRADLPDKIFQNEHGKFLAIAETVKERHDTGQPVLIGTVNIDKSETLSDLLKKKNIPHEVLNAKQHEREAEIVANAGKKSAVTIATNMAGRGTDIKLEEGIKELGGLMILGTERHESRRIDNQLRGRSGRQGDPGISQFFIAVTDPLMKRFGGDRMQGAMKNMGLEPTEAIENKFISKSVESAQKKIEGFHFDSRKHVVQYDDVMNIHREKIYAKRKALLFSAEILQEIEEMISDLVGHLAENYLPGEHANRNWDLEGLVSTIEQIYENESDPVTPEELKKLHHRDDVTESITNYLLSAWDKKRKTYPENEVDKIARYILLRSIDELWLEHIDQMTHLRDRVALSGYAQKDPLMEYRAQGFEMFAKLLNSVRSSAIGNLFRVRFEQTQVPTEEAVQSKENTAKNSVEKSGLTRQQRRQLERKTHKK